MVVLYLCYSTCRLAIPSTDCPKIIHTSYYAPTSTEQLVLSIDTEKVKIKTVELEATNWWWHFSSQFFPRSSSRYF